MDGFNLEVEMKRTHHRSPGWTPQRRTEREEKTYLANEDQAGAGKRWNGRWEI